MKKVIIRTREDELTTSMYIFGNGCAVRFVRDLGLKTYGEDWKDCAYSNESKGLSCWVTLSKSGTISVCVFSK